MLRPHITSNPHVALVGASHIRNMSCPVPITFGAFRNAFRNISNTASTDSRTDRKKNVFIERRDLESYRRAFDRVSIPDSLERIVNQHMNIRMSGAEALYRMLSVRGVRYVFGYSGGAVLPFVDQFHESRHPGRPIKFVNTAHEQTAAHAAQAVGRVTGRPGIVVVTSGPGLTNCITAMQDALMDGDPMLVLSGQVTRCVTLHSCKNYCRMCVMVHACLHNACANN